MSPYTLEAEVKTTASTNQGIISWGNFGTANRVNAFRTQGASSLVNYWWASELTKSTGGVNLADGAWHHVMAAFDGTTRSLHVDSSEIGSDTPTTSLAVTKTDNFCVGFVLLCVALRKTHDSHAGPPTMGSTSKAK